MDKSQFLRSDEPKSAGEDTGMRRPEPHFSHARRVKSNACGARVPVVCSPPNDLGLSTRVTFAAAAFALLVTLSQVAALDTEINSASLVGEWGRTEVLAFEGHRSFTKEQIVTGLSRHFDFHLAARPSAPLSEYTALLQRLILSGYQRAGFPEANIAVGPEPKTKRLLVTISEGPRYLCGIVKLTGGPTLTNDVVRRKITEFIGPEKDKSSDLAEIAKSDREGRKGDPENAKKGVWIRESPAPFDAWARQSFSNKVVAVLLSFGFQQFKADVNIVPDPARNRADLVVDIVDARLPRTIEEIQVHGLKTNSREQLLNYLNVRPGMEFQYQLLTDVTNRLWNSARFLKHKVSLRPLQKPGCVRLVLELLELEEAPALDEDFTPEQKALLKCCEWLARRETLPEDLVVDFEWNVAGFPLRFRAALSDSGIALLLKHAESNEAPALLYAALNSTQFRGLYSPMREQKLVGPPDRQAIKFLAHLLPTLEPKGERRFSYTFGASFCEASDRLCQAEFKVAPVAVALFRREDLVSTLDQNLITISLHKSDSGTNTEIQAKIDATTGRLLSFVLFRSNQSDKTKLNFRMEAGAFERAVNEIAAATVDYPNVFAPEKPISSALGFIAADIFQTPVARWLRSTQELSTARSRVMAWGKTADFQGIFAPLDPLWPLLSSYLGGADEEEKFEIPERPAQSSLLAYILEKIQSTKTNSAKSQNPAELARQHGTTTLLISDALWEHRSWPWTLVQEAVFTLFGQGFTPAPEIRWLLDTESIGPIGCWMWASAIGKSNSKLSEQLLARGRAALTPAEFQKDLHRLLPETSAGGQLFANTLSALGSMSDNVVGSLAARLSKDDAAFFRQCVQLAREAKGRPAAEVLGPAIEQNWERVFRPRLEFGFRSATLRAASSIANDGNSEMSEASFRQTLASRRDLYGNEHLEVASALFGLAGVLLKQRNSAEAESLYREAVALRTKLLGREHLDVATGLDRLAEVLKARGKLGEAEAMLRESLAIRKKLLGTKRPEVATSLNQLALVVEKQSRFADAEPMLREELAILKELPGKEVSEVIALMHLAELLMHLGKPEEAETMYREALALARLLGNETSVVADLLNNLASVLSNQSKLAEAEPMFREALAMRKKFLGNEDPSIADSLNYLAGLLWKQGKLAEAEPMFREALAMRKKLLGNEHPTIADLLNDLAGVLWKQGKPAEAEPMFREALAMRKKLLGNEHPSIADSLNDLAGVLWKQGKPAEAEPMFREALAMRKKLLGNEHPDVAGSLILRGAVLQEQGNLAEAEPMFREALAMRKKFLGNEHPDVADSLNRLAGVLWKQAKLAEAEPMFCEALAMRKKFLGNEHPSIADSLNDLAAVLQEQGKPAEAEPMFREALAMRMKLLGNEHSDVAASLDNLARVLQEQGKLAEAELMFREALAMQKKLLGNEHPYVAGLIVLLATVLQEQGKLVEAETMYREALAMQKKLLGNAHLDIAEIGFKRLVKILLRQDRVADAESAEVEFAFIESAHASANGAAPDIESEIKALTESIQKGQRVLACLMARFFLSGRQGNWKAAASDLFEVRRQRPNRPLFFLAPLLVETGDTAAYDSLRLKLLSQFGGSDDPLTAAEVAMGLVLKSGETGVNTASHLADTAITGGTNHACFPYFLLVKALTEYRKGRSASATDWARKSIEGSSTNLTTAVGAESVLAMAQHQLNQSIDARQSLAHAAEISETKLPRLESGDLGENWPRWLIAHILLREARGLIETK